MLTRLGLLFLLVVPATWAPPPRKQISEDDKLNHKGQVKFFEQFSSIFGGWDVKDQGNIKLEPGPKVEKISTPQPQRQSLKDIPKFGGSWNDPSPSLFTSEQRPAIQGQVESQRPSVGGQGQNMQSTQQQQPANLAWNQPHQQQNPWKVIGGNSPGQGNTRGPVFVNPTKAIKTSTVKTTPKIETTRRTTTRTTSPTSITSSQRDEKSFKPTSNQQKQQIFNQNLQFSNYQIPLTQDGQYQYPPGHSGPGGQQLIKQNQGASSYSQVNKQFSQYKGQQPPQNEGTLSPFKSQATTQQQHSSLFLTNKLPHTASDSTPDDIFNHGRDFGRGGPYSSNSRVPIHQQPDECFSQEGNYGVCSSAAVCGNFGGEETSSTSCGEGFVCCVQSLRKCDQTSRARVTNIKSPYYPGRGE